MSELKLTYYANIAKEDDSYIVTFSDLANCFTYGETLEEALFNAQEALDGVLAEMTQGDYEIPYPSEARKGEHPIPVSPEVAAPILLHMLRIECDKTLSQVAKTMNVPYQQYQRLEHNCNMTLKSLHKAAAAMGARVELRIYLND